MNYGLASSREREIMDSLSIASGGVTREFLLAVFYFLGFVMCYRQPVDAEGPTLGLFIANILRRSSLRPIKGG
jgi:hypothetical protein